MSLTSFCFRFFPVSGDLGPMLTAIHRIWVYYFRNLAVAFGPAHLRFRVRIAFSGVPVILAAVNALAVDLQPTALRCEGRENPIGIDALKPRLSWILEAAPSARGVTQTAYQVLVASTAAELARENGDLWDSGRVESGQAAHVEYQGSPLGSRQRCWWKVRVWNADGKGSKWSKPAHWSMGLLDRAIGKPGGSGTSPQVSAMKNSPPRAN
jgi:alpha-L-rhamnosidase